MEPRGLGGRLRILLALLVAVVPAVVVAGCGGPGKGKAYPATAALPSGGSSPAVAGADRSRLAVRARGARAPRHPGSRGRRAAPAVSVAPAAPPGPGTVAGALRAARRRGALGRVEYGRMLADLRAARRARARLSGTRRAELGAVLAGVESLAARGLLSPSRLRPSFLTLARNTAFWSREPLPAAGQRGTFGRDPLVWQYVPGQGLQIHPLGSWGRANALAGACLRREVERTTLEPCRRAALRRALDRLAGLATRRDGGLAWEYLFAFGGGRPPWISGMAQGTAVQALARGAYVLRDGRYLRLARRALRAFERPPPLGVAVPAAGGTRYVMYSFAPGLRILNGELQALSGLKDLAVVSGSATARDLFAAGERAARPAVAAFDTGSWSRYSAGGAPSTLGYHQLLGSFLGDLCLRTHRDAYCAAHRRFARYEQPPPRVTLAQVGPARAGRPARLRVTLSRLAWVRLRAGSPGGARTVRDVRLPAGAHTLTFTPPRPGTYQLQLLALGLTGPWTMRERTLRVR